MELRRPGRLGLGTEAQDALDAFLNQVLAAETRGVRDLEALAADFTGLDITVKREMEAGRDEVRVMTAHGAKGLEAPIVILPETTLGNTARGSSLLQTNDSGLLWSTSKSNDNEPATAAREILAQFRPQLIQHGRPIEAGIEGLQWLSSHIAARSEIEGAVIHSVEPRSEAARLGLQGIRVTRAGRYMLGDVVVAVDGAPVRTLDELRDRLESVGVGGDVTLTIERDGKRIEVRARLQRVG